MKRTFTLLISSVLLLLGKASAQSFSPIALTNYNMDAIAEATTALANTTGSIDGSNYVMYSVSYGTVYNVSTGLPNNGIITAGTSTYQLGTYSVNNICITTFTNTTDSLIFVTPGSYSGISILCFSTEGNGTMSVTVRFTDNTTQVYSAQTLTDWFTATGAVYSGFDRVNRSGTTPANAGSNPNMFAINLPISCANRAKLIKNVKFLNTGTNPRNVIMAISGAAMPTFTATSSPVTCSGGHDGSATVTAVGGIAPYTYTWSTTPTPLTGSVVNSLPAGVVSITAQDAGLCAVTLTVNVNQSLVTQPSLAITANLYTICAGGTVTLSASGASSYTWNTSANTTTIGINPSTSTTYTVGGYTSFNCYRTGSLNITVNPLPVITFTAPASICLNTPPFTLTANPANGTYAGPGINPQHVFSPTVAGIGTKTISYTFTDGNNCTSKVVNTVVINALPVVTFTLSGNSLCANTPSFNLNGTPANGVFTGTGVTGTAYTPSVAGVGTQTASYTFTDANNCVVTTTSAVMINPVPTPVFQTSKKFYCINSPTLFLNAQPSGGTFSGPGTSTIGAFSPSLAGAGVKTISYTYTDFNGCSGMAAFVATVSTCEGIEETAGSGVSFMVYPNPSNGAVTVKAAAEIQVVLINSLGQILNTYRLDEKNNYEAEVTDLASGVYFVSGTNTLYGLKQKIIVTR